MACAAAAPADDDRRTIVVIGATGRQGGASVDHLLKAGTWRVVGISRDPSSKEAKALVERGVVIRQADCCDKASLVKVLTEERAYGLVGVTNPFQVRWGGSGRPTDSVESEEVQGRNIADAAAEAGVSYLVFLSVASAHDNTGIATFDAKARVEEYIKAKGEALRTTVLAPVGFLENMESPFAGIKQGVVPGLLKKGILTQMISVHDIGFFVALAFARPDEWVGRRFELAGTRTNAEQQAEILARLRNEPGKWSVSTPPDWVFKLFIPRAVGNLKRFLEEKGTRVDIEAVRALHPGLMDFEAFARWKGWDKKAFDKPGMCAVM